MSCPQGMKHCKNQLSYGHCRLDNCAYVPYPDKPFFVFSHYSRENVPKKPPKYKVGDVVILKTEREITSVGQDCDGTMLYGLDNIGFGWSERDLRLAH